MPELSHIDPRSVALLVMDYQVDTLTWFMTAAQSADAIACVLDLIALARGAGMMVIHVVVAFRCGHPEVSPRNCGVDGVNSVGDSEPERTAWLVLVPGRLVWLRDSVTATTTDLADDIAQLLFNRALSEFATAMKAVRSAKSPALHC